MLRSMLRLCAISMLAACCWSAASSADSRIESKPFDIDPGFTGPL
jgi:hypothetical protein